MKILVACEESQAVTKEFRRLGHEAYSCDTEPCSGGHPEWHIQEDVLRVIDGWRKVVHSCDCFYDEDDVDGDCPFCPQCKMDYSFCPCPGPTMMDDYEYREFDGMLYANVHQWDMMIAFPPCTHLAVSGAKHFEQKRKDGRQQQGIDFFMKIVNAPIERIAVENPVGIMSTIYRKPDQIIQPWQFGDSATKTTCLWLKNLPLLKPTNIVDPGERTVFKSGKSHPKWYADIKNKGLSKEEVSALRSKMFTGIAKAMAEQWSNCSTEIQQELNC